MAYRNEDIQEVVCDMERPSGAVRISTLKEKDTSVLKAVDIRYYYEDKETGELKPTQKGVRLGVEELQQLSTLLSDIVAEVDITEG